MRKVLCIALSLILFILSGCNNHFSVSPSGKIEGSSKSDEYLSIVVTNKFLYHMVKDIVKDKHSVKYMLKSENDQWLYEYSDDSLDNISKKDLFIYIGAGYEPWIDGFVDKLKKGKVAIINASRGVRLLPLSNPLQYGDEMLKENPNYWLNPDNYKIALANIKNAIQDKDPKNRAFYQSNFDECIKGINDYLEGMKELRSEYKNCTFVVVGDNLDYFTEYYNLKVVKLSGEDYTDFDFDELDKKFGDEERIIFLYDNQIVLSTYSDVIEHYNMLTAPINVYDFDETYSDILDHNIKSLQSILQ